MGSVFARSGDGCSASPSPFPFPVPRPVFPFSYSFPHSYTYSFPYARGRVREHGVPVVLAHGTRIQATLSLPLTPHDYRQPLFCTAPMSSYQTIAAPIRIEIDRIKASRFIADVAPAASIDEAKAVVAGVAATCPDANHHCFAWRIHGDETRASDDGEPSGSAGRPILNRIIGAELERTVVVVTRYFGGTKLGTGGLVRAYGAATEAALLAAEFVTHVARAAIEVRHAYALSGAVKSVLVAYGLEPTAATYEVDVSFTLHVPLEQVEALAAELSERTAGQVVIEMPAT